MANFDRLDALVSRATTRVFGEAFTITPMTYANDPNSRPRLDNGREPMSFNAILHDYFSRNDMRDGGSARALTGYTAANLSTPAGHTSARYRIVLYRDALPYRPQDGDVIWRAETGESFKAAEVRQLSDGGLTIDLNAYEPAI